MNNIVFEHTAVFTNIIINKVYIVRKFSFDKDFYVKITTEHLQLLFLQI